MKIAVPSGYNNTPVDVLVVGQNSIEDFLVIKTIKMDYSIGELDTFGLILCRIFLQTNRFR